jgi:hypothetical protein
LVVTILDSRGKQMNIDEIYPDVTDRQIRALRREANSAGDLLQVAICDIALASGIGDIAPIDETLRAELESLGIIPESVSADTVARAECARAISEARAARLADLRTL